MRTREQKEAEVASLQNKIRAANTVLVVDYRGLTVADANDLRTRLRKLGEENIEYCVAKNTLVRLASRGSSAEGLSAYLTGPTALAFAYDEPSALAKALVTYAKENEKFEVKGGLLDGEIVDLAEIRQLAELPSRDELRARFLGTLQSPMEKLAGTLRALLGHLRNALEERQKQLEAS
jgi:large subunit ribosomal protein L10